MEGPEAQRVISLTMVVTPGRDQRRSLNGGLSDARVCDLNHCPFANAFYPLSHWMVTVLFIVIPQLVTNTLRRNMLTGDLSEGNRKVHTVFFLPQIPFTFFS